MANVLNKRGFSLVELLVTLVCMLLIMASIYTVFNSQNKSTNLEEGMLDAQMGIRVSVARLVHIFSHAGFGCKENISSSTFSGEDPDTGYSISPSINSVFSHIINNVSNGTSINPDSVIVSYGFRTIGTVNGTVNANTNFVIEDSDSEVPSLGSSSDGAFKNYVSFFPSVEINKFYDVGSGLNVDIPLNSGDIIYMVSPTRVKIDNSTGIFMAQNFAYDSISYWEISANIEDFQVQYSQDGTTWLDVPSNPNSVRAVRFWLLAKSSKPDPGYSDNNIYNYAGQSVGPFHDAYHRILAREVVWVRNQE